MVLAVGGGLGLWLRGLTGETRGRPSTRPIETGAAIVMANSAAVLEALEDPVLVVSGDESDDIAGRRLIYANAAARELCRTSARGRTAGHRRARSRGAGGGRRGPVRRHRPARRTTRPAACRTGSGGSAPGRWLARDGARLALLTLRDETELRRNERMRADFLANASHELRTPLASLTGFIETLRGHARDDAGARDRFLGIMHDQAGRMARLIDDLM